MAWYEKWWAWLTLAVGFACLPATAGATTIETFSFIQQDWALPDGGAGRLTGTFSGVLAADGTIPLANLTQFSATYTNGGIELPLQGTLLFFAFDATPFNTISSAPSSTLDFVGQNSPVTFCVGAAVTLSTYCDPHDENPADAKGSIAILSNRIFAYDSPVVTLLSRVDVPATPPEPASTVPEPGTLALFGSGLSALGMATRKRVRI
jgi:hypothetical protein